MNPEFCFVFLLRLTEEANEGLGSWEEAELGEESR